MAKKKEKSAEKKQSLEDFLQEAKDRLKKGIKADEHNRIAGLEDLKFLNGDQWDPVEKNRRKLSGRPCLTINKLPKYTDQVHGEMRQNRPKIKIRPVDSTGDIEIAKIRQGIISNAEYLSNAEAVYDYGGQCALEGGFGAWRVLTRYIEENPFWQEFYIEAILNPFLLVLDPDAKDACGADAEWGFLLEKMSRDEFNSRYPDADLPGEPIKTTQGIGQDHWYDEDTVTVAEYFIKKKVKKSFAQMEDGQVMEAKDAEELIKQWKEKEEKRKVLMGLMQQMPIPPQAQGGLPRPPGPAGPMPPASMPTPAGPPPQPGAPQPGAPQPGAPQPGMPPGGPPAPMPGGMGPMMPGKPEPEPKIAKRREAEVIKIKHYVITALDILSEGGLEGEDFAGKYIPLIPVYGKERNVDGKRFIRSLIRDSKDSQRLVNFWETSLAETVALAPKAPWLGTAKMFEGYEEDYSKANVENYPMLKYNIDDALPQGKPERTAPGQIPAAIFAEAQRAEENLKSTLGMFKSDVGDQGPERTGRAIIERQKPGDTGTYAFMDNWARSIKHTGKVMDSMIPDIFDTERVVRVRHEDDTESFVPVNTEAMDAFKMVKSDPQRFPDIDKKKLAKSIMKSGQKAKFNDITAGHYDCEVHVGPSYATQRAEAADGMVKLFQTNPKASQLLLDLVLKNLDFKDADEAARRIRKTLPPGIIEPQEGEDPPQPMPPSPQVQVMQAKLEVEKAKLEVQKIKVMNELQDTKGQLKQMVIEILKELHGPTHKADQLLGGMM